MYAIIETGGRQVEVTPGQKVKVENLGKEVGDTCEFEKVLIVRGRHQFLLGAPTVENSKVVAEVVANGKAKKIIVFKKKRRKGYKKKSGHRQQYTELLIKEIVTP